MRQEITNISGRKNKTWNKHWPWGKKLQTSHAGKYMKQTSVMRQEITNISGRKKNENKHRPWGKKSKKIPCGKHNLNKKSPRGIGPRRFSLSARGAKYSTVTQDMSPSGVNFSSWWFILPLTCLLPWFYECFSGSKEIPRIGFCLEWRDVYLPRLVISASKGQFMSDWIVGFQSSLAPSSVLSLKRS